MDYAIVSLMCNCCMPRRSLVQVIVVHSTVAFPDLSAGALSTDSSKNLLKKNIADGAGVPPAWVAILSIAAGRAEVHYAVAFPAANVEMAEKFHETAKLSPSDVFDDSFGAAKTVRSQRRSCSPAHRALKSSSGPCPSVFMLCLHLLPSARR